MGQFQVASPIFRHSFFVLGAAASAAFVAACNASSSSRNSSLVFRSIRSMNKMPFK